MKNEDFHDFIEKIFDENHEEGNVVLPSELERNSLFWEELLIHAVALDTMENREEARLRASLKNL